MFTMTLTFILSLILTSAAGGFCRVTGVAVEEGADLSGLSKDWRSRQEAFPVGGRRGRGRHRIRINLAVMGFLPGELIHEAE